MAFKIVTIAELHKNKGLEYGLEALSGIEASWDIFGEGEERKNLETIAKKLNVNVGFLGFKENAALQLKEYDLFLFPSLKEGLPYVLLEAAEAGLPVVATNVGGIPDIIEPGRTGLLVPPKDPVAMRAAIVELINNPKKRETLGLALKEKVSRQFSLAQMLEKTIALYE